MDKRVHVHVHVRVSMYSLNRRISAQCGLVTFAVFGSTCTSTDYLTHHIYTKCLVLMLVLLHPQSASSVARGMPPVVRSSDGQKRLTRSGARRLQEDL